MFFERGGFSARSKKPRKICNCINFYNKTRLIQMTTIDDEDDNDNDNNKGDTGGKVLMKMTRDGTVTSSNAAKG